MQPTSLIDRHHAEERHSVCNVQRLLLTASVTAAALMFCASRLSAPVAPPPRTVSAADIARYAMQHRAKLGTAGGAAHQVMLPPPSPQPSTGVTTQLSSPASATHPRQSQTAGVTDPTCHARLHTDYMGESAPVWGLGNPGFHLKDASECCAACQAHAAACGKPGSSSKSWWPARPELRCGNNRGCNLCAPVRRRPLARPWPPHPPCSHSGVQVGLLPRGAVLCLRHTRA